MKCSFNSCRQPESDNRLSSSPSDIPHGNDDFFFRTRYSGDVLPGEAGMYGDAAKEWNIHPPHRHKISSITVLR
jgi:hypothetical protein